MKKQQKCSRCFIAIAENAGLKIPFQSAEIGSCQESKKCNIFDIKCCIFCLHNIYRSSLQNLNPLY